MPVPKKNLASYRRMASDAAKVRRKHGALVNDKAMKDPRTARIMKMKNMPFDSKRMVYGGFKVMVDA